MQGGNSSSAFIDTLRCHFAIVRIQVDAYVLPPMLFTGDSGATGAIERVEHCGGNRGEITGAGGGPAGGLDIGFSTVIVHVRNVFFLLFYIIWIHGFCILFVTYPFHL